MPTADRLTADDERSLRQDLPTWRRIRQYAVPARMIAAATTARLAGDWVGACEAARVTPSVDLDQVRDAHGHEAAEEIADALHHLAPDLLRWHLPRVLGGRTSLATKDGVVLSTGSDPDGPLVRIWLPHAVEGSQRLRLDVVRRSELGPTAWFDLPPHLWDVRRADELAAAWGVADRPPPRPGEHDGYELVDAYDVVGIWRAAGIELDPNVVGARYPANVLASLAAYPMWPGGLAREARRLAQRYRVSEVLAPASWRAVAVLTVSTDGGITARIAKHDERFDLVRIGEPVRRRPADLDLLRHGLIEPDDLHPLIRSALFPDLPAPAPAAPPALTGPPPVRVRCGGDWHQVQVVDGRIRALFHSDEEEEREALLRALGGTSTGCFATLRAWTDGMQRLPRRLKDQRRDLLLHILHEPTDQILARFDAGHIDPHMRDGRGWTLMHLLSQLDHAELLPRLLAAGVEVDAYDATHRTPLHVAVTSGASTEVVRALWLAGADPQASNEYDETVLDALERERDERVERDLDELAFLRQPRPTPESAPTYESTVDA